MKPLQFIVLLFGVIVADCVAPRAYGQTSSEVVTLSAGNVIAQGTNASATLNGFVHTNMFPVQAWFEWGEGERFDQQSPATNLVAESIAYELSGLSAGMLYHYRIVVSNNLGVVRGSSVQFATPLVSLQGDNPLLLDYQHPFVDPGSRVTAHPLAVKAGRFTSVVLKADGTPVVWGDTTYGLTNLPALEHSVLALRAGAYHALALLQDGSVFGWGRNDSGQADVPTTVTNPVALAAGGYHSLAVLSDGSVIGWGRDDGGQISIPADATNVVALDAGLYYSAALRADGSVVAWGTNNYGQTDVPADATNLTAIACGSFHMLALREDGTVVSWGRNDDGQTNVPPAVTNVVAIAGGGRYSLALLGDGSLIAWGGTNYGQTNIPPEATNVVSIAAGSSFGLALREDGEVIGWGQDNYGQATVTNNLTTLDAEVQVVGTVDVNVPAQYELSYTATNILGAGGLTSRMVTVLEPVAAPQCVTLAASGLTNGMGTLNGRVFPNGAPTLAWFEWGVNNLYGSNSPIFAVGEGINGVELSYLVSNLTAGVLYHCRIVASNEVSLGAGDDRVFWIPQTPLIVTETNDAGPGSLRQALLDANNTTEPDTITFDIGGGGLARIEPLTPLPPITHPVLIDGTTQPGYSGMPLIELSGTNVGSSAVGLEIQGGYSTVRGLVINGFLTGIMLTNNGANVIQGNFLGTDPTGTNVAGGVFGVYIVESVGNRIGGTAPAERNVISGHSFAGLSLRDPGASNNVIAGNFIGTDVTGRAALGADQNGVYVRAAPYNQVGGTVPGAGNVISGNGKVGVLISRYGSDWATGNRVEGNFIGVDVTGTNALGNGRGGVALGGTTAVWIGGTNAHSRNIISANGGNGYGPDERCGVSLDGVGTRSNHVVGNFIGTDVTGMRDLGNNYAGIYIGGGDQNWIGGSEVGAGNLISGNDQTGVMLAGDGNLSGQVYAWDNIIQGNWIGTDVTGTNALGNTYNGVVIKGRENLVGGPGLAMGNVISGNGASGIYLDSPQPYGNRIEGNRIGTDASGTLSLGNGAHGVEVNYYWPQTNVVGGLEPGAGNVIAFNAGCGIAAADYASAAYRATNAFLGNAIFANGGLGIDLNVDGVTPNDPGDIDNGANALQNFPTLTEAILTNSAIRVTGYLDSAPSRMFRIEFFASSACDPSGYGEGQVFLGATAVNTDASGLGPFTADLPPITTRCFITATATLDGTNSTSEFASCIGLVGIPYVVTTLPATGVAATDSLATATLHGSVSTNVLPAQVWFEWATAHGLTQQTSPVNLAEGDTGFFSTELSGLTAGLVYRYRAFATNDLGLKHGETRSFWAPQMVLQGDSPMLQVVGAPFVDPGATPSAFVVEVAAGYYHDLALRADGSVVGWGRNAYGETNIPTGLTDAVSIAAGVEHSLALRADGTVVGWGRERFGKTNSPPEATNIVAISTRTYHNLGLRSDGTVLAWGWNNAGQTNVPPDLTNAVAVAAGFYHSLALRSDGTLVAWGQNDFGQTNIPPGATNIVAIAAGPSYNLALRNTGTVLVWGNTNGNQGQIPPTATNIVAIAAGQFHVLGLSADGTIVGWGQNVYGQTDIPADATNVVAISALGDHSLALKHDGSLVAWGKGDYGQTNIPADLTLLDLPVTVTGSVNVNVPGTYALTYSTTNSSGAAATTTRTVVVETPTQPLIAGTKYLEDGSFHFTFTNIPGALFNVLATTNVSLPLSQWTLLGMPIEGPSGVFQFTDVTATNQSQRYYRLVWP